MLNTIWAGFILVAFLTGLIQAFAFGQHGIFADMTHAMFDAGKAGFEISLGLTGVMTLWLGVMKIGEKAGFIRLLARLLAPLFSRIFPEVPPGHPALGSIAMKIAADMLGLANASTPFGIKAMQELQTLNPTPDRATQAQVLFFVINVGAVTFFPVSILTYRAQMGAHDPADVLIPIMLTSCIATLGGVIVTALSQKIRIADPVVLAYLGGMLAFIGLLSGWLFHLSGTDMQAQSAMISNLLLVGLVSGFTAGAVWKKINVYDAFIEGAQEGFSTAIRLIPYLVAMLVAIALLRSSGAFELIMDALRQLLIRTGLPAAWSDGLPTMLMKPLSGSGARAMMLDTMKAQGADSFAGHLVSVIDGSSETTFYMLAVYFGVVNVRHSRQALAGGLFTNLIGFIAAMLFTTLFFG